MNFFTLINELKSINCVNSLEIKCQDCIKVPKQPPGKNKIKALLIGTKIDLSKFPPQASLLLAFRLQKTHRTSTLCSNLACKQRLLIGYQVEDETDLNWCGFVNSVLTVPRNSLLPYSTKDISPALKITQT